MENKNRTLITSPRALKVQDDLNRFFYKHLVSKLSKALMVKPQYVWKIKSAGVPEILKEFDMNWPLGKNNKAGGFLCVNKSFANLIIHYSLGGTDARRQETQHGQLTHTDTKLLERFFTPLLEFSQQNLSLPEDINFLSWIDDPRLLPFLPPGQNFYAFEMEISFDKEIFPMIFMSHFFEVEE